MLGPVDESTLSEAERNVLAATRAVIEFRSGNVEQGRKLYQSAVDAFKKLKDLRSETLAKYFWAKEEQIVKSPTAETLIEEALSAAEKLKLNELLSHGRNK